MREENCRIYIARSSMTNVRQRMDRMETRGKRRETRERYVVERVWREKAIK